MNELSIIESIVKIALQRAEKAHAKRITNVYLVVGELSSMDTTSIQKHWRSIAKDTVAEKAKLHIRHVPAELQCMACFHKYHPTGGKLICPKCGSVGAKIISGEEFTIEKVVFE